MKFLNKLILTSTMLLSTKSLSMASVAISDVSQEFKPSQYLFKTPKITPHIPRAVNLIIWDTPSGERYKTKAMDGEDTFNLSLSGFKRYKDSNGISADQYTHRYGIQNLLTDFRISFQDLRKIDLSGQPLTTLPDSILGLKNLNNLNISHTGIKNIDLSNQVDLEGNSKESPFDLDINGLKLVEFRVNPKNYYTLCSFKGVIQIDGRSIKNHSDLRRVSDIWGPHIISTSKRSTSFTFQNPSDYLLSLGITEDHTFFSSVSQDDALAPRPRHDVQDYLLYREEYAYLKERTRNAKEYKRNATEYLKTHSLLTCEGSSKEIYDEHLFQPLEKQPQILQPLIAARNGFEIHRIKSSRSGVVRADA